MENRTTPDFDPATVALSALNAWFETDSFDSLDGKVDIRSVICWADSAEEYIVAVSGGGCEFTRECISPASDCSLGLCTVHCEEIHEEKR